MKSWDDLLWLYLSNEMTAADRAAFERLLASNPAYRKALNEWQRVRQMVRTEAQARAQTLPPLGEGFFRQLDAQPATLTQPMQSVVIKQQRRQHEQQTATVSRRVMMLVPLTAAAAVIVVFMFVMLVILANQPEEDQTAALVTSTPKLPTVTPESPPAFFPSPGASITPSLIEPVISAPARVVSRVTLPNMDTANGINWAANGTLIIDGYAGIWLYDDFNSPPRIIPIDNQGAVDVAVSPDGGLLAVLDWAGAVSLWNPTTGAEISRLDNAGLWDRLQFNVERPEIVSRLQTATIQLDANNQLVRGNPLPQVDSEATYNYLHPADPSQVVSNTHTGRIVIATRDGQLIRTFGEENPNAFPRSVTFNAQGTLMALGQDDGMIRVYDLETGTLVHSMSHNGRVYDLAFSPDGRYLASMIETRPVYTLWMWNLENNLQYAAVVHDLPLIGPVFNTAGDQLAISTVDGRGIILDVTAYQ